MIVVGGEGRAAWWSRWRAQTPPGWPRRSVGDSGGRGGPPGGAAGGHRRRPAGPGARWVIVVGGEGRLVEPLEGTDAARLAQALGG